MKCCFLVLHYKNIKDTIKCISSIVSLYPNEQIVVVDNGSNDNTGEDLQTKYICYENIHFIILKVNYGFSKGNNIGYKYIKENISFDFLIVCNNDIEFKSRNMIKRIEELFWETYFGVLGPDIYLEKFKEHQNPFGQGVCSVQEINREINDYRKEYERLKKYKQIFKTIYFFENRINKTFLSTLINKMNYLLKRKALKKQHKDMQVHKQQKNVRLHGACLIFSKLLFKEESKLFYPETDFYGEEDFLLYRCMKKGITALYDPSIMVYHLNSASTFYKTDIYKKKEWVLENLINSRKIYIEFIKNETNE